MDKQTFVDNYLQNANDAASGSKIFPLVILSAAAVESAWGSSQSAVQYNNFFGIKAFSNWHGKTFTLPTHEVVGGETITINAAFRAYDSPTDCFKDYVSLLEATRYVQAGVESAVNEEAQIQAIAKAGYSTSPTYAHILTSVLEELRPMTTIK
jgi:flagellum-specific peptidoglycan hydrolase FlgJ